ncbi:MAG: flagellar hook-basal body complex protein FliE [Balneolaceae bacterium]
MDPIELNGIRPFQEINTSPERSELSPRTSGSGESFADMLTRAVGSVDETMKESDQNVQSFIAGETDNVHDVMISMQRAQLSFQMMVEMRNKAIEAYHEISRMSI